MKMTTATRHREGDVKPPTRSFSKKQEDTVAKNLGGRRTSNSGATMFDKGDVILNKFLLECKTKTTHADSISIKKAWFEKNKEECLLTGTPYQAVVFNFGPDEENHYIIDEFLFKTLVEYLDSLEDNI